VLLQKNIHFYTGSVEVEPWARVQKCPLNLQLPRSEES